jgi:hypothetical protein
VESKNEFNKKTQRYANNLMSQQNGGGAVAGVSGLNRRRGLKPANNRINKQVVQNRQRQARQNKQANQRGPIGGGGGKK